MTDNPAKLTDAQIVRIVENYYAAVDSRDADRIAGTYLPAPTTALQFNADEPIVTVDGRERRLAWSSEGGITTHYNASVQAMAEGERTRVVWIADFLPDTAKKKPQQGRVIAVGSGRLLDDGTVKPLAVKEGDTVIYAKYGGTEVTLEGQDYMILDEDQIYAIVEG